mgnify:CR=1 FL=1
MANEFVARKGLIVSGSARVSGNTEITGSLLVVSGGITGSLLGTSSWASSASAAITSSNILGGTTNYIPVWSSNSTLSSSRIFQTQSSILIGATTQHTPTSPDTLGVFAASGSTSYNLISGHGNTDNYLQLNLKNFNSGPSASTDIVATADTGTETSGFVDLGINNSGYTNNGNGIGSPLDAYLYVKEAGDLLIGNQSADKRVVIFTGPGDALSNARVFVDPSGSVGINSSVFNTTAPEALLVQSINDQTYNLVRATAGVDNYIQFNIQNTSTGNTASSDVVATADNGNETTNYIDMGINGSQYAGTLGSPNDTYLYSAGNHLLIGTINPNQDVKFFVGSTNTETAKKLVLRDNNLHDITGSITVTGGVTSSLYGTASYALTAPGNSFVTFSIAGQNNVIADSSNDTLTLIAGSGITLATNSGSDSITITATAADPQAFNIDTYEFIGDGVTVNYDIVNSYAITSLFVAVDGLSYNPTDDYTLSTNILTFVSTPPSESSILVRAFVNATTGVTGSFTGSFFGTITSASFAVSASWAPGGSGTVTSITAGDGLSGGTITNAGTITLNTSSVHFLDGVKKELDTEGVISSSTQFKSLTAPFTGSFTGSFFGNITSTGTGSFGNLLPPTDNTGVVGSAALTWANGQFTNLTVDTALTVGSNIQLGPSDELRMGGATSFVLLHDGTNNIIRSDESDLHFRDSATTRIVFGRTTGAISASGGMTASGFLGTASWAQNVVTSSFATTASYAVNGGWLRNKAGSILNTAFVGNPRKAAVNFTSAFPNTNYAITITGEDARTWTVEGKVVGGFTASANSNTTLAGTTYWIATAYGEA